MYLIKFIRCDLIKLGSIQHPPNGSGFEERSCDLIKLGSIQHQSVLINFKQDVVI